MSALASVTDVFMSPGMRRPYPKGAKREMTTAWKERAREKLQELGKTTDWLDAELGVTRGMARKMLGTKQNTSALVDDVCRILEIDPPVLLAQGADEREAIELLRQASPDQRQAIWAILKLVRKEPS